VVDDQREPLLQISIGRFDEEVVMVMYVPLGLDLRPGVLFQVDERLRREFPYQTCLPRGCRVVAGLDSEMQEAMRAGNRYRVGVIALGADQIGVIEGSLTGFTAGLRAITPAR
jgi:invasion protein IalB